jgi:hypothetical protein
MPMVAEMRKATTQGIASNRILHTGAFALAIVGVRASVCSFSWADSHPVLQTVD